MKGSSSSNTSGRVTRARASDTLIRIPPDSSRGRLTASAGPKLISSRLSPTRCRASVASTPSNSSGRRIFSSTVRHGNRLGSWKTSAMRESSDRSTVPAVGSNSPAISLNAVDLPQPEGPTRDTNSPSAMFRSTRSSTGCLASKATVTPSNDRADRTDVADEESKIRTFPGRNGWTDGVSRYVFGHPNGSVAWLYPSPNGSYLFRPAFTNVDLPFFSVYGIFRWAGFWFGRDSP